MHLSLQFQWTKMTFSGILEIFEQSCRFCGEVFSWKVSLASYCWGRALSLNIGRIGVFEFKDMLYCPNLICGELYQNGIAPNTLLTVLAHFTRTVPRMLPRMSFFRNNPVHQLVVFECLHFSMQSTCVISVLVDKCPANRSTGDLLVVEEKNTDRNRQFNIQSDRNLQHITYKPILLPDLILRIIHIHYTLRQTLK